MIQRLYRVALDGERVYAVEEAETLRRVEGDIFSGTRPVGAPIDRAAARVLAPIQPGKIVAVGLNYRDHAAERHKAVPDEPLLFLKPPSAVIGPGDAIRWPAMSQRVDYEGEMALVIGRVAKAVPRDRALDYLLGLTCINDVTARDLQSRDSQYTRAKGFDTFAPIGPCIAIGLGPDGRRIETRVNGELRQSSTTAQLIFDARTLLAYITQIMTLMPGDVIATGTPAGIGPLTRGDRVTVQVEEVGELTNTLE